MMATLRRFMLFLLRQAMEEARSRRKTGTRLFGSRLKPWISDRCFGTQKGSPAKRAGHAFTAAQYSQESPENNALFVNWLAVWPEKYRGIGPIGRSRSDRPPVTPPQSGF